MKQDREKIVIEILANYMLSQDERGLWHMTRLGHPEDSGQEVEGTPIDKCTCHEVCEEVDLFDLFRELHEQHLYNHRKYFMHKKEDENK
tara:strand:+ start:130 stop:396 length:267 start_codon:yes stop_codon:yes gene_type:complete